MSDVVPFVSGRRRRSYAGRVGRFIGIPWGWLLIAGGIAVLAFLPERGADTREAPRTVAGGGFSLCGWGPRIDCVVDGDTLWVAGVKIRLEGINAPETGEPQCGHEARLGEAAKRRLLELVNEGPFEIVAAGPRDTDRYGRKLRRLMRGGRSLGDRLVAEGLAREWVGHRRSWCG